MTATPQPTPSRTKKTRPAADFIHVGLPKCGSTYLQYLWGRDATYTRKNPSGLVKLCRDLALSGSSQHIDLGPIDPIEGETRVISSEGFTWGWINQPEQQAAIGQLQETAARVLGNAQLADKVLIIIRDPVDWLRACHEQTLKEGGCESYADFLSSQRRLCETVLDLHHLLAVFADHFAEVVVLSADEMKETPQDFWTKYSDSLSVAAPALPSEDDDAVQHNANRRLGKRALLLARLNSLGQTLSGAFQSLDGYYATAKTKEIEQLKPTATVLWKWYHRRLVEFASDEALAPLAGQFDLDDDSSFQQVFVDPDLHRWIETRYLQPLESVATIPPALLARYRRSLAEALRET